MVNKNRWISHYNNLNPKNQLEVASAIANELQNIELNPNTSDYDKEKTKIIREFFNKILLKSSQNEELKKMGDLFRRFEKLSQQNKAKVIDEIVEIIKKYLKKQEKEDIEEKCEKEGHIFGNWLHNKWTTNVDNVIEVKHENWKRTCKRCGFVEVVVEEPKELIESRQRKDRNKKLERAMHQVKNTNN